MLLLLARSTQDRGHLPAEKALMLLLFPFLPLGGSLLVWLLLLQPLLQQGIPGARGGDGVNGAEPPQGQISRQMTPGEGEVA